MGDLSKNFLTCLPEHAIVVFFVRLIPLINGAIIEMATIWEVWTSTDFPSHFDIPFLKIVLNARISSATSVYHFRNTHLRSNSHSIEVYNVDDSFCRTDVLVSGYIL